MGKFTPFAPLCDDAQDARQEDVALSRHALRPNRIVKAFAAGVLAFCLVPATLAGCSAGGASNAANNTTASATSNAALYDTAAYDLDYTDRECDPSYDATSAIQVTLSGNTATASSDNNLVIDGGTVTIARAGVYVFSGTLDDGQIVVNCTDVDKAKVQVVLDGVDITCKNGSAICVTGADKVFVTLAEGSTNTLTDGAEYTLGQDKGDANAAIYSKCDLVLQGSGELTINGNYKHAVHSKDDLVVTGGTYNITAVADGLRGKDSVKINGGTFNIETGEDAVKSSNSEKEGKGFVAIDGGTFNINAGDDAIHAERLLVINDGEIDIAKSYEGLEGQVIIVNGGTTHLVASDDGMNAASAGTGDAQANDAGDPGASHQQGGAQGGPGQGGPGGGGPGGGMDSDASCGIQINGGRLVVNAAGDGVDSNGTIEINGGIVLVDGPTSGGDGALDFGIGATISGGTVIMSGSQGMAESFTDGPQAFTLVSASGSAGQNIAVRDSSGKVVASFTPTKQFQCVLVSAPGMTEGSSWELVVDGSLTGLDEDGYVASGTVSGGTIVGLTPSTTRVSLGRGGGPGQGGPGGGPGQGGTRPERPEGARPGAPGAPQ